MGLCHMIRLRARPVTIQRVRQKDADAQNSEDSGDCIQHCNSSCTQQAQQKTNRLAQSKRFWLRVRLGFALMIPGNT
jgi:hypothetical protein